MVTRCDSTNFSQADRSLNDWLSRLDGERSLALFTHAVKICLVVQIDHIDAQANV